MRAVLVIILLALGAGAARADILLDGRTYPESDRAELAAICRGLAAKANESLTYEAPEIDNLTDPASDYNLSMVTFSLYDCRKAGLN